MSEPSILKRFLPGISTFAVPFKRFGIVPIGGRSTAVKLKDGSIWFLVSSPLDATVKAELEAMGGPVKYLVVVDIEHTISISSYAKAFPSAICVGPDGVGEKVKDVKFAGEYKKNGLAAADEQFGFEDEIISCYFANHANKDIAFLHKASKTLIQADLIFNLPAHEQHAAGQGFLSPLVKYLAPGTGLHKKFAWTVGSANREEFAKAAKIVADWDFDKMIPCHGQNMESGAKQAWMDTYADVLALAK